MKNVARFLLFCIIFLTFTFAVAAQQNSFTGSYNNATIAQLVQDLEAKSPYHFYYQPEQTDSFRINISFKDATLQNVLGQAFANTAFHYAIDEDKNVYITKDIEIKTELPLNFFAKGKEVSSDTMQQTNVFGSSKKPTKGSLLENKVIAIGNRESAKGDKAVLAGYVRNVKTGEPVVGASITLEDLPVGVSTDQYGYYSLPLPAGRHVLNIQGIGMKDTRRQVMLYSNGNLNIDMGEQVISLKEVVVSSQKVVNINRVALGIERLDIKTIKQVPSIFGEADILRVVLTLPGVKTVGEASTGFNVRGGSADQNLILFNDATIYNPSHFFGFFSAFNPDVVKDVELYKSSIPAKYGGRLSSVLDITSREGNSKNITGSAGIGLLTSRVNIEGPIKKDKTSFILGARTTYANWMLNLLPDQYKNSKAAFYDVNFLVSHKIDNKNNLYFTSYISKDHFNLNNDTTYGYSNTNLSLKWKHTFSNKFTGAFVTGYDRYQYNIQSAKNPVDAYKLAFDINQINFKADFNYYLSSKHTFDFGVSTIRYKLHPGSYQPLGKESLVVQNIATAEQAQESAIYFADRFNISSRISLNTGIRYSLYNYLGPKAVNIYADGLPKDENNILQTKEYKQGSVIKTYHGPEYRVSARYALSNSFSIKGGYNSLRQYIHVLSNTTAISPTDIWKLSDPNIHPQYGDQVSLGLYKNLKSNTIETSVEVYYKRIKDYLDYKSGAVLVLNQHIETDVLSTQGKAYGVEMMIKKQTGKLNGWLSYTYSRILLKMQDSTQGELINGGAYYPGNYDKPHDATLVSNYRFSHRFSISLNATYSTGRPITLPIGRFYYAGSQRVVYSDRNAYRIPDYFRTDFSMNIEGNHKVKQKTHNSWTLGVYNLTGRKNPYSVYFISENGVINGYKLSIFGSAIPFINYNVRF